MIMPCSIFWMVPKKIVGGLMLKQCWLLNLLDYTVEVYDLLPLQANFEPWIKFGTTLMPDVSDLI